MKTKNNEDTAKSLAFAFVGIVVMLIIAIILR